MRNEDNAFLPLSSGQISLPCEFCQKNKALCQAPEKTLKQHTWVSSPLQVRPSLIFNCGIRIEFTDRGAVTLSARFLVERDSIELTVADTGIGIPEQSLTEIFELFRQLDGSNTRQHEGVALGLYLVRKLAHLIAARISVESTPGQGSTFTVSIPTGGKNIIMAEGSRCPDRSEQTHSLLATPNLAPAIHSRF